MVEKLLFNEIDDSTLINGYTIAKYLESSNSRVKLLREVYKNDGIFIFANRVNGLKNTIPFLIPNSNRINELKSLIGLNNNPTIKGFCLILDEVLTIEQFKNLLETIRDDKILIKNLNIENNILHFKYIYSEEVLNPLIRGDFSFDVEVEIQILDDLKYLVSIVNRRSNDYKKVLNLFQKEIGSEIKFKVSEVKIFEDIASYTDRNQFLKNFFDELPNISFVDEDNTTIDFELLGIGSFEAFRNTTEYLPRDASSFSQNHCTNIKSKESNIVGVVECIDDLNGSCHTSPMNFEFIYKSNSDDFILIDIKLKKDIEVSFKSFKKGDIEDEDIMHHKRDIMSLSNKIINKEDKIKYSKEIFLFLMNKNKDNFN